MEVSERSSPGQQPQSTQGSGPFIHRKHNNDQCLLKSHEKPWLEKTFQDLGKEIWENMSQGYNSCIFAFGQTGSGKCFSLLDIQEQPSLVSFFCSELFNSKQGALKGLRVSISFVELYDEEIRDLLAPNGVQRAVKRCEYDPSGPYAEGLSHHIVGCYEDVKQMLIAGNKCRTMAANAKSTIYGKSSQPCVIFTLTIRYTNGSDASSELCRKVSFVDLGGSEAHEYLNLDSSMGIDLFKSSSTITDNGVDQRDSLLSWFINQFLGGFSKASIVAMIDPHAHNYQETLTALTSSAGAKHIVIRPLRPEDSQNTITHPDVDAYPNHNQLSAGQNIAGTTTDGNHPNNHTAEGPRENVKVFYWDEPPDETFLESRLKERFPTISKGLSLIPLCETAEDKWKSEAREASVIIFCHSMQSNKHIEDGAPYMQFCIEMDGPADIIVMVTELEDSASRDELSRVWDRGPYKQFHLLLVTKEEMKIFKSTDKGKENAIVVAEDMECSFPAEHSIGDYACDLVIITQADKEDNASMMGKLKIIKQDLKKATKRKISSDNTMEEIKKKYPKVGHQQDISVQTQSHAKVQEPTSQTNESIFASQELKEMEKEKHGQKMFIRKHHQIGIFSRSAESDYDWLQTSLRREFSDLLVDVRPCYISNNGRQKFWDDVSQCTFGILYHTMRRGRLNITNVTDSLYDEELKYMAEILGKENVIVVADDLEDISPEEKHRILEQQYSIGECSSDLVLLKQTDKENKVLLMEKLETIRSALLATSHYVRPTEREDEDDQLISQIKEQALKAKKVFAKKWNDVTAHSLKPFVQKAGRQFFKMFKTETNVDKRAGAPCTAENHPTPEHRRHGIGAETEHQRQPNEWQHQSHQQDVSKGKYSRTGRTYKFGSASQQIMPHMKERHKVGIFSRSSEDDYRWLHRFILSEFRDYVQEVRPCYISNNGRSQFWDEVSQCTVAILYHTKNRGRINITDVVDSLYDEELQYLAQKLGRNRVMVVVDDLEDSGPEEKERILSSQGSIEKWASDLILISSTEKDFHASKYKQLLLEKFSIIAKV